MNDERILGEGVKHKKSSGKINGEKQRRNSGDKLSSGRKSAGAFECPSPMEAVEIGSVDVTENEVFFVQGFFSLNFS